MTTRMGAAQTAVIALMLGACGYSTAYEFDDESGCVKIHQLPPRGVDVSSCSNDDGIYHFVDPDGHCWRMGACGGVPEDNPGWRAADWEEDAWCYELARQVSVLPRC